MIAPKVKVKVRPKSNCRITGILLGRALTDSTCKIAYFQTIRDTFEPVWKALSAIRLLGEIHGHLFCTKSQNAHSC